MPFLVTGCGCFLLTIFIHFAMFVESRQIKTLQLLVLMPDLDREREHKPLKEKSLESLFLADLCQTYPGEDKPRHIVSFLIYT